MVKCTTRRRGGFRLSIIAVIGMLTMPSCGRRPALPPGLSIEWDWPVRIYDSHTYEDYAPSVSLADGYEVDDYWVSGRVVYGTLVRDHADATVYFVIVPQGNGFAETEYFTHGYWRDALAELGIHAP